MGLISKIFGILDASGKEEEIYPITRDRAVVCYDSATLDKKLKGMQESISDAWEEQTYPAGSYCIYKDHLWVADVTTSAIPEIGGDWRQVKLVSLVGGGSSGEPSDSYEEVATGLRDVDGNMIFKKSFKGKTSASTLLDENLTSARINMHEIRGYIRMNDYGTLVSFPFSTGNSANKLVWIAAKPTGLFIETEGHDLLKSGQDFCATIYYTYN